MLKNSIKNDLQTTICSLAQEELLSTNSTEKSNRIFDQAVDDLICLSSCRYAMVRQPVPKSCQWLQNILPDYDDNRFRHFIRVSRPDFGFILALIENSNAFKGPNSNKQISIDKQLAITLYKMGFDGTGASLCNVAATFGIGDGGTIMKVVSRVIEAIMELQHDWISWPNNEERKQMQSLIADKLPKCVGFIDGSHINLDEAPVDDPESYFSRKQRYAIQLQAICDMDRRIRSILVGYPGSVHDARVYNNSDFGQNPNNYLSDGEWIAGDSAYGVTPFILTPFRKNSTVGTAAARRKFNKYFAGFRVNIECTFGILKEIFGSLKGLRVRVDRSKGHKIACKWITACCILYNIILPSIEVDLSEYEADEEEEEGFEMDGNGAGEEKRIALFNFVLAKLAL